MIADRVRVAVAQVLPRYHDERHWLRAAPTGSGTCFPTSLTVEGCQSEEVEFMTSATVKRVFEVDAPLEEAWQRLAEWSDGRSGRPISRR